MYDLKRIDAVNALQDAIDELHEAKIAIRDAHALIASLARCKMLKDSDAAIEWLDLFSHLIEPVKTATRATGGDVVASDFIPSAAIPWLSSDDKGTP